MVRPPETPARQTVRVSFSPSERARTWASTMAGHAAPDGPDHPGTTGGIRLAHSDSPGPGSARLGPPATGLGPAADPGWPIGRPAREEMEAALLAEGATRAEGAGDRARAEEPDPLRTCFERDRDRILHSTAFRRLAGKTQVFVFPDDHQRTRLTHALEVAQVAGAVARATGLNQALTEAIALGHDCGHGPGGHASEDALGPYVEGGFDHAVWGADAVLVPLNLTSQVLDGIRNHSWSRPAPSTPEGEVVSWADRCAYTAHDLEDAQQSGIVTVDMLPPVVVERAGRTRSRQLLAFITDMVGTIIRTGVVGMSEPMAEALAALRAFDYEHIYLRPASQAQAAAVIDVLRALVEHYADRPHLLAEPPATAGAGRPTEAAGAGPATRPSGPADLTAGSPEALHRSVAYVGGMTDRFAFRSALALLDWDPAKLPRGVDTPR
ncbi:MAG: HD domain-containing protein [Acidimicrobiales bacterium]